MKPKLVFASHNVNKVTEVKTILGELVDIITLEELDYKNEIVEYGNSLRENAEIKAKTIFDQFQIDCFSDDTGLEVDSLNGRPGVYSSRYANEIKGNDRSKCNREKLLKTLENKKNRDAKFRTVISLIWRENKYFFEGKVYGRISKYERGGNGFGYDSVFIPKGSKHTFAEMTNLEKLKYSHRTKAFSYLIFFLQKNVKQTLP